MKKIIGFSILFHFFILGIGMSDSSFIKDLGLSKAYHWYHRITGAGGGFGFFSPNIAPDLMLDFKIEMADGSVKHIQLQDDVPRDVALRIGNMVRLMSSSFKDEKIVRSIAASLSGAIFRRHPEAVITSLTAAIYKVPSMRQFQKGERPKRHQVYFAKFKTREKAL